MNRDWVDCKQRAFSCSSVFFFFAIMGQYAIPQNLRWSVCWSREVAQSQFTDCGPRSQIWRWSSYLLLYTKHTHNHSGKGWTTEPHHLQITESESWGHITRPYIYSYPYRVHWGTWLYPFSMFNKTYRLIGKLQCPIKDCSMTMKNWSSVLRLVQDPQYSS